MEELKDTFDQMNGWQTQVMETGELQLLKEDDIDDSRFYSLTYVSDDTTSITMGYKGSKWIVSTEMTLKNSSTKQIASAVVSATLAVLQII